MRQLVFSLLIALLILPNGLAHTPAFAQDEKSVEERLKASLELLRLEKAAMAAARAGHYGTAEPLFKDVMDLSERTGAVGVLAHMLTELGDMYALLGRFSEAEAAYERVRSLSKGKEYHVWRFTEARALHQLALLHVEQDRFETAERNFLASRTISEALVPNHEYVAESLNALAELYIRKRRFQDALPLLLRALQIAEARPPDPLYALILRNFAEVNSQAARLGFPASSPEVESARERLVTRAEKVFAQAIAMNEKIYGPNHPAVAETLLMLAEHHRRRGVGDALWKGNHKVFDTPESKIANELTNRALAIPGIREVKVTFASIRKYEVVGTYAEHGLEKRGYVDRFAPELTFGSAMFKSTRDQQTYRLERMGADGRLDLSEKPLSAPGRFRPTHSVLNFPVADVEFPSGTREAFLYIHGFSVPFERATQQAAQIAFDLQFRGATFAFIWPANGWLGYLSARNNAAQASEELAKVLQLLREKVPNTKFHLIAHSMGSLVLTRALEKLRSDGRLLNSLPPIGEIIFAHPDLDIDLLDRSAAACARLLGTRITVYTSRDDRAAWISRWLNWMESAGGALQLVDGVDTIDTSGLGVSLLSSNHSVYAVNPILFGDIHRLLQGVRPPDQRTKYFEMVATDKGQYWRYRPLVQ